ncbi:MAG: CHRD domain-containing protein [Acidobacteria bacterium]|nr:CHRD domain-containing protein [Acidobacteriota bacterium]
MRLLPVCLLGAVSLAAQTAETQVSRAILLPANEVPAVSNSARAIADVAVHTVRDASGAVVSGTIEVLVRSTLAAAVTVTGVTLHNAPAGKTGPAIFSLGFSATNTQPLQTGADSIHLPIAVTGADAGALAGLRALVADPASFYLNLSTTTQPNGLMRGQLAPAAMVVLLARMDSAQAIPAPASTAAGLAQVVAIGTRDASGKWTSGEVYLSATCSSNDSSLFTGFQVHPGAAGATGAAAISATLFPGLAPDYQGRATLGPYYTEISTTTAAQLAGFAGLFSSPATQYIDIRTAANPGGLLRGQLHATDAMRFPLPLDSANELHPTSVRAVAPSAFTLYTMRNEDGSIAAATLLSDIDYRFPAPEHFLGAYLHNGGAKTEGPISLQAAPDWDSDTGIGNYYGWTLPLPDLAAVDDLVKNPAGHYASLHTVDDATGAARAQFAGDAGGPATVAAAIAADLDKTAATVAPGGLISIFGTGLVRTTTDLSGWSGRQLPGALNGTSVQIAGRAAPLVYVSPGQINAQVPFETPAGVQTLTVDNGSGASAAYSITVAAAAPAIFFYPVPAVLKNANYSLVTAANPARTGDVLLVFATGMGQTAPAAGTGLLVASDVVARTAPVTATIGGRAATVVYSIASPGFTGLYQVAVTVPAGVSGASPLELTMGAAVSNTVTIDVQ